MQTALTPLEVASVARGLIVRAQARGPQILGAQLGKIVNSAVYPRSAKDFGGLRALVEGELRHLIRYVGDDKSSDVIYEIVHASAGTPVPSDVPANPTEVAGGDLWRFFSNPNLACVLALTAGGQVVVAPQASALDAAAVPINRFGEDRYKALAEQFLKDYGSELSAAAELHEALKGANFYKAWIAALRKARSGSFEPLKSWEILRVETVAKHLNEELVRAGLEPSRAAEISQLARPVGPEAKWQSSIPHTFITSHHGSRPGPLSTERHSATGHKSADELTALRQLVHQAVDRMSLSELSEIRLSAALLLELAQTRTL